MNKFKEECSTEDGSSVEVIVMTDGSVSIEIKSKSGTYMSVALERPNAEKLLAGSLMAISVADLKNFMEPTIVPATRRGIEIEERVRDFHEGIRSMPTIGVRYKCKGSIRNTDQTPGEWCPCLGNYCELAKLRSNET